MKEDLNMTYRKITRVPQHANSEENLVKRQQCAVEYLRLWKTKTRLINIDESWLGMTDFRRRKWCEKESFDSIPTKLVRPRISVIAAVDNFGDVFVSLL